MGNPGLQHHILPKELYENNIKANLEKLTFTLRNKYKTRITQKFKDKIKYYFQKFMNRSKQVCATRNNQAIYRSLLNLSKDSDIKVCKLDKGRGVAVLNLVDYSSKLDSVLYDFIKFIEVNDKEESKSHPLIAREQSIRYHIRKCLKPYGNEIVQHLLPTGSTPGKLYGLIKYIKNKILQAQLSRWWALPNTN